MTLVRLYRQAIDRRIQTRDRPKCADGAGGGHSRTSGTIKPSWTCDAVGCGRSEIELACQIVQHASGGGAKPTEWGGRPNQNRPSSIGHNSKNVQHNHEHHCAPAGHCASTCCSKTHNTTKHTRSMSIFTRCSVSQ
jgi:hypothetical protein